MVGAILLTGGASRRMGRHKAAMTIDGVASAERIAQLLARLGGPVCEVGPGWSSLPAVVEDPPKAGPLAAIAAGWDWLAAHGHDGAALVLACDLPLIDEQAVAWLATRPGGGSVFPVIAGTPQWLCARWSANDLARAAALAAGGQRAVHRVFDDRQPQLVSEPEWTAATAPNAFEDANTPEALHRLLGNR